MNRPNLPVVFLFLFASVPTRAAGATSRCLETAPGECLQITMSGEGRDVVLIPGLFGSAFAFRKITPLLITEGYRAIVIEPLGVGHSSRPKEADYTLTAQADRIHRAMDLLGVEDAVLVAHSVGASMALRLAHRHPERIRAVVSLEGGPAEEVSTPGFRRAMMLTPLLKLFGGPRLIRGKVRGMLVERSANPAWVTDEIVAGYTAGPARDMDATLDALKRMSKSRESEVLGPRLPDIQCPVQLLLGASPHAGGPSETEIQTLRQSLKSLRVERVSGAGHFLFEEAPEAVVNAVVEISRVPRAVRRVEN